MKQPGEKIVGYTLCTMCVQAYVSDIMARVKRTGPKGSCRWMACMNPHSYAVSLDDPSFSQALHNADWLIPDGIGVVLASIIIGGRIRERITGSDIFSEIMVEVNRVGGSVFFLGSTCETLAAIRTRVSVDFPNVKMAGTFSPPFKQVYTSDEIAEMVAVINQARPDILWVGMTAPKQEKWIYENKHLLEVKFIGAIGAVFDFYAERIKRSHQCFQMVGLEWLPRLLQEPRRLWRRMFISAPIFIWHVILQKIRSQWQ